MAIKCPYCIEETEPKEEQQGNSRHYICGNCKTHIHRDYTERNAPKKTIGLVGFTGHGKTVYLTALFYLLKWIGREGGAWENFTWNTLDSNTHKIMFEHVRVFEEESKLPDSTPENFPHPALIKFEDIPFFRNYFLSFYDTAGRVFQEADKITDTGRFVAHSNVVFFVISMNDCGNNIADKMEEFLDIYSDAVYNKLRADLKKNQHLIIILSKADDILNIPEELKKFLISGSYKWYSTQGSYDSIIHDKLKELQRISKKIKAWLDNEKNCKGFTKLAQKNFKSCEYVIVSSTGAKPVGNKLATKLKPDDPKHVLAPFLLALDKIRPKGIFDIFIGE